MRLAFLLVSPLVLLAGCGCSAYTGAGDRVYARGQDQLVLCENGGFLATIASPAETIEGTYSETPTDGWTGTATEGASGDLAFDYLIQSDQSLSAPQLGQTAWQPVTLDQTGLDHADVLCSDLETRVWWKQQ